MTAAPLDLDALEAAERVATRAPWRHEPMYPMMIGHRNVVHTGAADPVHFGVSEHKDGSFEDAALTVALRNAAPALFAAARERDKLREALEAADKALEPFACACERECYDWPPDPKSVCPRHIARETHAKIRAALSRDSSEEKHGDGR